MSSGTITAEAATVDEAVATVGLLSDELVTAGLRGLRKMAARIEAVGSLLLAEAEKRGIPIAEGFGSTTAWLISGSGDPPGVCRSRVRTARNLRHMPATRSSFLTGEISEPRVRLLVEARATNPELFERDEGMLVTQAGTLDARSFPKAIAYWRRLADHEGHLRDADRAFRRRRLHASVTWNGVVRIDGGLDPEGGATVITALRSLTDPWQVDVADHRTPAQRRADALVEICRRHLDQADRPVVGGERPHVTVTIDLESLEGRAGHTCEVDPTGFITSEAARRLACDARVSRIITRGDSQPLDVGRATRTIPPPLRRALDTRDGGCSHPGCGIPTEWCDAHHIRHWADGGPTSLDNLRLLCRRHHRAAHHHAPYPNRE